MARREPSASELIHQWHQGRGAYRPKREWDMARACCKYELSLRAGEVTARSDGDVQAQLTHFREAQERTRARDSEVRQLLYERGVSMCYIVNYCNFARRLARVCGDYEAATLRHLVQIALDRWCAKGLDREVLLAIAAEVVGVRLGT